MPENRSRGTASPHAAAQRACCHAEHPLLHRLHAGCAFVTKPGCCGRPHTHRPAKGTQGDPVWQGAEDQIALAAWSLLCVVAHIQRLLQSHTKPPPTSKTQTPSDPPAHTAPGMAPVPIIRRRPNTKLAHGTVAVVTTRPIMHASLGGCRRADMGIPKSRGFIRKAAHPTRASAGTPLQGPAARATYRLRGPALFLPPMQPRQDKPPIARGP